MYSSKPAIVNRPIGDLYNRFSDLTTLRDKIAEMPQDKLAQVGDVAFDSDSITIKNPQIGDLRFEVVERVEPTKIVFGATSSPIPLNLVINLTDKGEETTEVVTAIDVELPMMLRPLLGGKLQEAADKFGQLLSTLNQ